MKSSVAGYEALHFKPLLLLFFLSSPSKSLLPEAVGEGHFISHISLFLVIAILFVMLGLFLVIATLFPVIASLL